MPLEDKQARRLAEREIAKHNIDNTLLTVAVINKVCYIGGQATRLRGAMGRGVDIEHEMRLICEALSSISGINEVVVDARIDS
jgi:hypothetical protein